MSIIEFVVVNGTGIELFSTFSDHSVLFCGGVIRDGAILLNSGIVVCIGVWHILGIKSGGQVEHL